MIANKEHGKFGLNYIFLFEMAINLDNLTIVIVTFFSEKVIFDCIKSIPSKIKIIIVDNSKNKNFKNKIEKKFKNVQCILSLKNLGMGGGNNLGLKYVKTDYAFIINPDVRFEKDTIQKLIQSSKKIKSFGIISPLINSTKNPNYKLSDNNFFKNRKTKPFKVKSVDGFAMIFNLKKLNKLKSFNDLNYFDENIFLYLENDDLCKRVIDSGENIYVIPESRIIHLGASAVNKKYFEQIELSRNWHWNWSKFYFNKKHNGFFIAILHCLPSFLSAIIKYLFFSILLNKKKKIYLFRALGFLNAFLGNKSYYRPKIKN